MLSEQKLKAMEKSSAASEADAEQWVGINIDDLAQLIAAARVANAAARVERDRADVRASHREGGNVTHLNIARADLARALRHYTDQKVTA